MNDLVKGFKGAASARGLGSILAVFVVLVVLAYFGVTPTGVAARLSTATGSNS